MRAPRVFSLFLILTSVSLVACGDSGDEQTTAAGGAEETVEESSGTTGSENGTSGSENTTEPASGGDAVRSAKVEIEDFSYVPGTVTIEEGGKVTWQNRDSTEHTATLNDGSFTSGDLAEGKLKSQSFKAPGTFAYHCEIHPEMTGTVKVVATG